MGSEKFCLRWNDFENNISNAFKELRDDKDFFDVTIACDDEQIQTHKVILAACSPFFRNILRRNPHQHPLLYLKGVKFTDLQAVLNFMYHGEVNVAQEELNSFLSVAEDLRVKGLTQNQPSSKQVVNHQQSRQAPTVPKSLPRQHPQPPKRSIPPPPVHDDDEIQEVVPIKSEPLPAPQASPHVPIAVQPQVYSSIPQPVALDTTEDQTVATYQEETGYEDYGDYQDQEYTQADNTMDHTTSIQGTESGKGTYADFLEECVRTKLVKNDDCKAYTCNLCEKVCGDLSIGRFHLESRHFPNYDGYHCPVCDKFCKTKNALACHKVKCRRSSHQV